MCYVEDIDICRRCSIPWRATYDANNAYNESRGMGRWACVREGNSDVHIICIECIRADFDDGDKRLTMSEDDLSEEARAQLHKIRRIVGQEEALEKVCEELCDR